MRHTTSTLTATVLGAVLTASAVLAQQLPTSDSVPRGKSATDEATARTDSLSSTSPLYGMPATRGARYLLRNGLDYLDYQQYERALKFLREAETRTKELNDAEKLALKQGIERAQRGLRDASDAESPYALSEKSHHRNGFTPAKPEMQVSADSKQGKPTRTTRTGRPVPTSPLGSDSEDRGEPIRLASGEATASELPPERGLGARSSQPNNSRSMGTAETEPPASMPEIPQLPTVSQLPDLTVGGGSEHQPVVQNGIAPSGGQAAVAGTTLARQTSNFLPKSPVDEQPQAVALQALEPAESSAVVAAASGDAAGANPPPMKARDATPGVRAAVEALAALPQAPPLPLASADTSAATKVEGNPAANLAGLPATSTAGLAQPSNTAVGQGTPRNTAMIDVGTIPSSTSAGQGSQDVDPSAPAHRETEDPISSSMASPGPIAEPARPATATAAPVFSSSTDEELPPLPADLSRSALAGDPPGAPTQPSVAPVAGPTSPGAEELPLLPANLGRPATDNPRAVVSPGQEAVSSSSTPSTVAAATDQPAQPAGLEQTQARPDAVAPRPVDSEDRPAPIDHNGESRQVDGSSASLARPTAVDATISAAPPSVDHAVAADAGSTPNNTAPTRASAPDGSSVPAPANASPSVANPGLEPQPPAATGANVATEPEASSLPPAILSPAAPSSADPFIPDRPAPPSSLRPDLQREVERIARSQEDELRRQVENPPQPPVSPRDTAASDLRTQTQLDISRAPSPAEARPIKAIPVPEDWVPLPPRNWSPQRKYWSAAATCHLPLYFQDPVLERYGHSVEHFVGPIGKYLTYPVDDPTQSTQRNQLFQPFFSAGLMALQIAAWPYNLIMDPPWEAQYDLGYYRPGDNIPTDTYWLPLHGYGPPLHGSNY